MVFQSLYWFFSDWKFQGDVGFHNGPTSPFLGIVKGPKLSLDRNIISYFLESHSLKDIIIIDDALHVLKTREIISILNIISDFLID